jgi:hypothetical protein
MCMRAISIMSQLPTSYGGSQAKLIVAYTKNRSIGARLIRARL